MPPLQRFIISLSDPFLQTLVDLSIRERRTLNEQAGWLLEQCLVRIIEEQSETLDAFLQRTSPDLSGASYAKK